jgi:hypothetical protein
MHAISSAVGELTDSGVRVLSPGDPRIVGSAGEFLFVASDRVRSVRLVEDRHLQCIRASDFLWLISPDGYVGQSASMELGFAVAAGVPVYGLTAPADLTLRQYVRVVPSLRAALRELASAQSRRPRGVLIDPHATIEAAHATLEELDRLLARPSICSLDDLDGEIRRRSAMLTQHLRVVPYRRSLAA